MINTNISSGTPLEDVLPWTTTTTTTSARSTTVRKAQAPQTILVNDSSIECDGRFLLHLTATTALKVDENISSSASTSGAPRSEGEGGNNITRILWLANGGWTAQLVAQALKKMACPASAIVAQAPGKISNKGSNSRSINTKKKKLIQIRSLTQEISHSVQELKDDKDFCARDYVKSLYKEIKEWWQSQAVQLSDDSTTSATVTSNPTATCWLILDDASVLSALVGSRLTYALVMQLQALSAKSASASASLLPFNFMIRCSLDPPQEPLSTSWVGAGGNSNNNEDSPLSTGFTAICWEQSLVEIADQIVDVIPMASGYSSNVHGRLILTKSPRRIIACDDDTTMTTTTSTSRSKQMSSSKSSLSPSLSSSPLVLNYCLTDNKVLAFRIVQSS